MQTAQKLPVVVPGTVSHRSTRSEREIDLDTAAASLMAKLIKPVEAASAVNGAPIPAVPTSPNDASADPLTPRLLEVLQLIADGLSNRQIADQLVIADGTEKSYTSQIYGKLCVTSRAQAVARARELELYHS